METADQIRYLITSDADDDWQLTCLNVGHSAVPAGASYPRFPALHPPGYAETLTRERTLSEYQVVFISEGRGRLTVRQRTWDVGPGTSFLLFPGVPHAYSPDPDRGWTEFWVGFRGPWVDLLVKKGVFSPQEPIFPGLETSTLVEFQQILEEVTAEAPGYRLVAASRILVLLARLEASRRVLSQADGTGEVVKQARLVLEDQVGAPEVDLPGLARKLGLAYPTFSSLFHHYTGLPPHQYWLNLKVNRAKGLLGSGLSVKETAYRLGFQSEFYFSRLFKKKTGVPPSRWKA